MANRRKYTSATAFRRAVRGYLDSIRMRSIVYQVDSRGEYVRDGDGHKVAAHDADGNEMYVESYVVPPELHHIAKAVGVCYDTWLKYASGDYDTERNKYSEVCAEAKEECLRWALMQMHTRIKGIDAVEWILKVNYGISAENVDSGDKEITVRIKSDREGLEE